MLKLFQIQQIGFGILRDPAGDGDGGGGGPGDGQGDKGGAGDKGGQGDGQGDKGGENPPAGNVTLTQEQFEQLLAKAGGGSGDKDKDKDLYDKSRQNQQDKDKQNNDSKKLEAALRFNMGAKDWVKNNESLLPKDVAGIIEAADKETYDSPIQKDSAVKSGIVQAFFNVQENLDLLTASQKNTIEDFLKLSKNGKEEKAQQLYDSIFEPTFEMKKRISKAQQLNRSGERTGDDAEQAYKQKLMDGSRQHYMGEKPNA